MDIPRAQRDELKALSKEIFGASSRWQKMFEVDKLVTTTVTETVPGENGAPDTTKESEVPVLVGKSKQYTREYRTVDQVLESLRELKVKRDEFLAQMKKQQEEAKAKKAEQDQQKKLQEELGGSAL